MKRVFKNIIAILSIVAVLPVSCSKSGNGAEEPDHTDKDEEENVLPFPPETAVEENIFVLDYLSTLDDRPYLSGRKEEDLVRYIRGQEGKKPVLTMIDRLDYEVGKPQPLVRMAKELSFHPFFAQAEATRLGLIHGCGILTIYPVNDYDGAVLDKNFFVSGCKIRIPLQSPQDIVVYTTGINSLDQASSMVKTFSKRLHENGIVIGKVVTNLSGELKQYVETKVGCRLELSGSETGYDLFVMTPLDFVCREIASGVADGNIGHFRVSIEKLS